LPIAQVNIKPGFVTLDVQQILYLPALGPQGLQGDTGVQGPQGPAGADGAVGADGSNGVGISTTVDNSDGTFTLTYTDGTSFTTADLTGPRGSQGLKGDTGNTGATGADGSDGVGISSTVDNSDGTFTLTYTDGTSFTTADLTGPQGLQGLQGDTGVQGSQGLQGIQGVQGEKGDTGDQGPQGIQGLQGIQGNQGDTGAIGAVGNGIDSTTENNNGTLTFTYDDGTTFTTSNITTAKTISDDMIFDGTDDNVSTNDNYYYVSMVVNGNWRVTKYDKANINLEKEATISNNSSQTAQPTTLAVCTGLNYD
jgi:hypothetical protein